MKKILTCLLAVALIADDGIVVSTETKTVVVEVKNEWRTITFLASPDTGEISVRAVYETVTREDGVVKSRDILREASLPWSQATNIAPALALVREQFKAAMPMILTNQN